jgi:Cdc6-like AAA superfamily ATPase
MSQKLIEIDTGDIKQEQIQYNQAELDTLLNPIRSVFPRLTDLQRTTTTGTANWIFEDVNFNMWRGSSACPIAWISGENGTGKSHLAANIIKQIREDEKTTIKDQGTSTTSSAIYFCDCEVDDVENRGFGAPDRSLEEKEASKEVQLERSQDEAFKLSEKRVSRILCTLAWQIAATDRRYERYIISKLRPIKGFAESYFKTAEEIWNLLFINDYFQGSQSKQTFIILDGLTNLEDKDVQTMCRLLWSSGKTTSKLGNLKVLLLSRPSCVLEKEIGHISEDCVVPRIFFSKEQSDHDIETFIQLSISNVRKLDTSLRNADTRDTAVKKLVNAAQGVFESTESAL